MKKWMFTGIFILSMWSMRAADVTFIASTFKLGDATLLAGSMDAETDIAVPGVVQKGDAAEAIAVLTRFFETHKVAAFTVAHHADKRDTGFLVGKLATGNGDFRVNIAYSLRENKVIIQSIRIE